MLNSISGRMGSLRSCETVGSVQKATSPTASASESNMVASETPASALQGLKFDIDADIDVEVQSPDSSIWEALFADSGDADFMISSPRRDFMVCSPKRTNLSPSCCNPNSTYEHGMHGMHGNNFIGHPSQVLNKGKPQSPLHKVFNGETLALPTMDVFLDEFHRESYVEYPAAARAPGVGECSPEVFDVSLLECLTTPSSGGIHEGDFYHSNNYGKELQAQEQQQAQQLEPSYHGLLGPALSEPEQEQDSGLQLVHLLLACAEAVAKDDFLEARRYLHHLNRVVSPLGDSMQRVASCFTDALAARLAATLASSSATPSPSSSSSSPPTPAPPLHSLDVLKIYQILYQACPYIKFAHFTANQAIFEAFEAESRLHVVDLDIHQGYQWPAFIQALAARPGGAPFLRITGIGTSLDRVRETGCRLAELAHSLRVPFEFHAVGERLEDLRPHMLHRRVGEALAVNSVCRLHRVPGGALGGLVAMIRDQAPSIVTLVEQEASHNGQHFLGRFLEALHYYSAVFDSLDATFPGDSVARAKVEQYVFAPEIRNIVAAEGAERVERHERLEKWRKVMEGKGFTGVPLSANAVTQSKMLLGLYSCDGYRLTEDKGCLLLGWQDRPIIAASAWRC